MSVYAQCGDCLLVHPVGERAFRGLTTICPVCASPQYSSSTSPPGENKRALRRVFENVDGVGENTAQNLADNYPRYIDILKSDPSTLTVVDGVGEATAKKLLTELTPIESDAGDTTTEGDAKQINPPDTEGQADLTDYSWSSE